MSGKTTWVLCLVLATGLVLGGCAQDPGTGQDIILEPAAGGGYADCYRPCHQAFPSAGYGPWDVSGWHSRAGTPLADSPFWSDDPVQQAAALFSTVEHPGWGSTPESFDPGLTVWKVDGTEILDGPYYFRTRGTIEATHFGSLWVTNEPNKVTIFVPPKGGTGDSFTHGFLGYVERRFRAPAKGGVVDTSTPDACTASCHGTHPAATNEINRQWAEGAHHPRLKGPITYYLSNIPSTYPDTEDGVTAPANWHAIDHDDFSTFYNGVSRSYCLNCHSGPGVADQAPSGMTTMSFFRPDVTYPLGGGFITCNACHDGQGYPTAEAPRLRFSGKTKIFGQYSQAVSINRYIGSIDNLGNSAMCAYCHQGRNGCRILVDADIAGNQKRVRNRHDAVATVSLYPGNGLAYELTATYAYSKNEAHAGIGCTGCHMAPGPAGKETIGGHSFMVTDEAGSENLGACQSAGCHASATSVKDITNHTADWDGDPGTTTAKEEFDNLYDILRRQVFYFPNTFASASTAGAWMLEGEGGRLSVVNANWSLGAIPARDNAIRIGAYNYQTFNKEQAGWAHNARYSVQILRDTINLLRSSIGEAELGGVRP